MKVVTSITTEDTLVKAGSRLSTMTHEDRQKIVGAFAWLIQEDKKQNPELYKTKKKHG